MSTFHMFWKKYLFYLFFLVLQNRCDFSGFKELRLGWRMSEGLIDVVLEVSFIDCVRDCLSRKRCNSVSYMKSGLWCELNSNKYLNDNYQGRQKLQKHDKFIFTDMNSLDRKMAGACAEHTCSLTEKCIRKTFSEWKCEKIDCGEPNVTIDNAAIDVYHENEYSLIGFDARRKVRCEEGYGPGTETYMVCLANGSWSEPDIHCSKCLSLECSSSGYTYTLCDAQGDVISVSLSEQHSSATCTENYSFGKLENNIWVDKGCRATFRVCV